MKKENRKKEIIRLDLGGVNGYLLKVQDANEKDCFVLFDTGGPMLLDRQSDNRREQLMDALHQAGCNRENLKLLVLTHGDMDHVYNAVYLREQYHLKIAIHPGDVPAVRQPGLESFMGNFQYRSGGLRLVSKVIKALLKKKALEMLAGFDAFAPDLLMDESFDFSLYGTEAKVIHIPGHTVGSIAILFQDGSLICGDTFSNQKKPSIVLNANRFDQLDNSVEKMRKWTINTVYPGHGAPFPYAALCVNGKDAIHLSQGY